MAHSSQNAAVVNLLYLADAPCSNGLPKAAHTKSAGSTPGDVMSADPSAL